MLEQNIKYSSRLILNYFSANQVKNSNLKNNTSTAFCTINLNHYIIIGTISVLWQTSIFHKSLNIFPTKISSFSYIKIFFEEKTYNISESKSGKVRKV